MKHSDEICNRLLARDQRIAEARAVKQKQFKRADTLCSPLLPRLHSDVRMLASTTCAAFGGAGRRIEQSLHAARINEKQRYANYGKWSDNLKGEISNSPNASPVPSPSS